MALKADGTVWAWGHGGIGELGNGTYGTLNHTSIPVQVKGEGGVGFLTGVTAIAAGRESSYALKIDGTVWAWGYTFTGGPTSSWSSTPVQVKGPGGVAAFSNVEALGRGGDVRGLLVQAPFATLWTWGFNDDGQLGDGTTNYAFTPVQISGFGSSVYCPPV
jgi:alpha-tubulin suppressor-like RCC1 family protein